MQATDFHLDGASAVPVYAQLREQVLHGIARGALVPGQQLPTVREIAIVLRVNPNTVNRAYIELEREGVLQTFRGRGTFLAERPTGADDGLRRRRLHELAARALGEAVGLGYPGRELIDHLLELLGTE
ncbi:MAG TPA: GntR family transcriptional regulator [Verrucomicrobiae bacterium]|jgi:GntR family transcriptional regulator|nr:GntR family transcriptional regulator [Verrucomicrobiae bacterium]